MIDGGFHCGFVPFVEDAARQHNAPFARLAQEAHISTDPHHFPFIAATWMWLSQTHNVA